MEIINCLPMFLLLLVTITNGMAPKRSKEPKANFSFENMERVFNAAVMHIRCYFFANPTMARYNQLFYNIRSIMKSDKAHGDVKINPSIIEHLSKALECQVKYEDSQELARSCLQIPASSGSEGMGSEGILGSLHRPKPQRGVTFIMRGLNKQIIQGLDSDMLKKKFRELNWDPTKKFPVLQLDNGLKLRLIPARYGRQLANANAQLQRQKQEKSQRLFAMKLSDCKKNPEVVEACLKTREQKYTCKKGNQRISLNKLCNGKIDCKDGSDERNCYTQVAVLLKNTKGLMHRLKKSLSESECIEYLLGQYSELCSQTSFLDHLDDDLGRTSKDIIINVYNVYGTLKELFCFHETKQEISANIKYEKYKSISPDSALIRTTCSCKFSHCLSACLPICNITCERRHVLSQFRCADGKASTVPMSTVCDGFPDCDDKLDEANCSTANEPQNRITAQNILQQILKSLNKLISTHSNFYVLPQLIILQKNIVELQRNFSKQFDRESINIKTWESLKDVFPYKMDTGKFSWDLVDELYDRLVSFNEDLSFVYKLAPSDVAKESARQECPCFGGQCLQATCTMACSSACSLQESLMYYKCRKSPKRIRLGALCDGTPNCPEGDDEEMCITDKCKSHHFFGLLNSIRIGNEFTGDTGKALASWRENVKSKIDASLASVTKPDHFDLVNLIKEALHNLTVVYGSVESVFLKAGQPDLKELVLLTAENLKKYIRNCH